MAMDRKKKEFSDEEVIQLSPELTLSEDGGGEARRRRQTRPSGTPSPGGPPPWSVVAMEKTASRHGASGAGRLLREAEAAAASSVAPGWRGAPRGGPSGDRRARCPVGDELACE